ncbi:MAG: hypothetical protein AAF206_01345 [Bacteroidota bacterium]
MDVSTEKHFYKMSTFTPAYFSGEEQQALHQSVGKNLSSVRYIFWKNLADPFQSLDWIELDFADGSCISLASGEESDRILVRSEAMDFAGESARLQQQFNGQVGLSQMEMGRSSVWSKAQDQALVRIGLISPHANLFHSHFLWLDFGASALPIQLMQEGLMAAEGGPTERMHFLQ